MTHAPSMRSPASNPIRAYLATLLVVTLTVLAVVAGMLALAAGDGAADSTPAAEAGTARFEGYEAGIASAVRAQRAPGEEESRVAAAIAGK